MNINDLPSTPSLGQKFQYKNLTLVYTAGGWTVVDTPDLATVREPARETAITEITSVLNRGDLAFANIAAANLAYPVTNRPTGLTVHLADLSEWTWNGTSWVNANTLLTVAGDAKGTVSDIQLGANTSIIGSLPYLYQAITNYNDYTVGTVSVISIGSSVGVGATLASPSTQAPGAYFTTALSGLLNKLGNVTLTHYNQCVSGHAFASGPTDWPTAYAAATGTRAVVPIIYGMNDGFSDLYHNGQTLAGVVTFIRQIVAAIRANHCDPVLFTTPHPHSTRTTWTASLGIIYPSAGQMIPNDTTAQSIKTITTAQGASVPASYRHLRVNEMIRRAGAELGVVVIDAERCWFDALASYSEDLLFDPGEYAHPNLLGHQLSYQKAIDRWVTSVGLSKVLSATPPAASRIEEEYFNVQIASPISVYTLADKQYATLLVRARHPGFGGNHATRLFLVLGESATGGRVLALGTLQGLGSDMVTASVSGGVLKLTAVFDGTDIAYTLINGYPLP